MARGIAVFIGFLLSASLVCIFAGIVGLNRQFRRGKQRLTERLTDNDRDRIAANPVYRAAFQLFVWREESTIGRTLGFITDVAMIVVGGLCALVAALLLFVF